MTQMTNLDGIPYDVFYQVASTLDGHDFIHLSRVNKALNTLMRSESLARKTIKNHLLHTKEGQEATRKKSGYRKALGRLYDIKEAFATANPYSASIIGYGSAFLYSSGTVSYVFNDEIRVLDVHGASQVEQVLDLHAVLARAIPGCDPAEDQTQVSLLNYSHGVLAFMVDVMDRRDCWLLAVDMRRKTDCGKAGRVRVRTQLEEKWRLFVRHDQSYLYYGTHSALSYRGAPEWVINCVNLVTGKPMFKEPVQIQDFTGYEIGQTICFDVYQNHLYGVSTQQNTEEEVDWTSFYFWTSLGPDYTEPRATVNREWRRQHREGPINDTWLDISLREDETTGQLMILECRREWLDGASDNCRTYYMQPLPSPAEILASKQRRATTPVPGPTSLPNHPLTKTLDSTSKPNYEPARKRLRRHYHAEFAVGRDKPADRHEFILAKTKYRTYNLSASTFVDLVNDPRPIPGSHVPHDRLRLRTVSRKRKCPIDVDGDEGAANALYQPETTPENGQAHENSEERFASRGVHLWPPNNAPDALTQLLCPSKRAGRVQAMADERSLIYSVDVDEHSGHQALILINFDPGLHLPGLQRLGHNAKPYGAEPLAQPVRKTNQAVPSVREERALHLSIQRGYWLR
ncbi:hypothetical protein BDV25DRAFT_26943 [Aspergillus avenaceus]|uniref:F-box domain-containing protein n=1 Tax=Aspergillus avenaceus TaxID=36643 RepID=A0A5N6TN90_ASPAV|nr:hypothetical protein BDV25DRAFT_26943 [Aspergillus avenaceus]